jgi:asparagine synthase (glutamine-hydrolysing)
MCGFVAVYSTNGRTPAADPLARMTSLIRHRGPDDSGLFVEGRVGLGFRRLSILDLAPSGHQPMVSADGRHVIVFNGEIYNYVELRSELKALGHTFRSTGDTEVLLAAYRQWGRACLARLNGMWAFVVYDRVQQSLFGARDRFGVKPLFWFRNADSIVFASEIKALRDSGYASLDFDWGTIAAYLLDESRLDSDDRTFYQDVKRVPAGMGFEVDASGHLQWFRHWSLPEAAAAIPLPANPPEAFAQLFEDAVRLRMRSDVPVGVLLSGGLDSTSIICSMARARASDHVTSDFKAFSYISPHFDESAYIDVTLKQSGAKMCRLDEQPKVVWDDLERHLWYQDEPVYSFTSVISFQLMRLARSQGVTVLLNGQGADEVLAGYGSYFSEYWADLLSSGRLWRLRQETRDYGRVHGQALARRGIEAAAMRSVGRLLRRLPRYAAAADRRHGRRVMDDSWLNEDVRNKWTPSPAAHARSLTASLRDSLERTPMSRILRVEDRNSMAHGVEVRLPFLDYRLVSLAFRLGSEWKLRGPYNKFVLREAMRQRIPEPVRARAEKFGFPTSADAWLRGEHYEPFRDLLASRATRESGLWQIARVEQALERHRRGEISIGGRLFDVAQMTLWMEGSRKWPSRTEAPNVPRENLAVTT